VCEISNKASTAEECFFRERIALNHTILFGFFWDLKYSEDYWQGVTVSGVLMGIVSSQLPVGCHGILLNKLSENRCRNIDGEIYL